jgi:uncharacterized protein
MCRFLLGFLLLFSAIVSMASPQQDNVVESYTVANVPNVRLTDVRQYVSDPSALLSSATRDTINATLAALEHTTGIETAVVMLPSIGNAEPFDFAVQLFRTWGIGKTKSNNRLLVLYVEDQHRVQFVTGYGIEGTLTDALCKRIQARYMVPSFKRGDRDGGMMVGVKAVAAVLDGSMESEASDGDDDGDWIGLVVLFVGIGLMAFLIVHKRKSRCSYCGANALELKSTDHYRLDGQLYRKDIYVCSKCGRVVVKNTPEDDRHDDNNALLTGMLLGSMFGRGRGGSGGGGGFGSGFSGGSFGGGSTGGGGAGSSW